MINLGLQLLNIPIFQYNYLNQNDVLEIIVIDCVYAEFGFDKEAIRAAMMNHKINEDQSFEDLINKLEEYHNNSFVFLKISSNKRSQPSTQPYYHPRQ